MDRRLAKQLGIEILESAKKIARSHGIEATRGAGSFDDLDFGIKIIFNGKHNGQNKFEKSWDAHCSKHDLKREWLGKSFNGKKIMGLDFSQRKNIVALENLSTGTQYKCSALNIIRNEKLIN